MFEEFKSTSINGEMWKKTKKRCKDTENTEHTPAFLYCDRWGKMLKKVNDYTRLRGKTLGSVPMSEDKPAVFPMLSRRFPRKLYTDEEKVWKIVFKNTPVEKSSWLLPYLTLFCNSFYPEKAHKSKS